MPPNSHILITVNVTYSKNGENHRSSNFLITRTTENRSSTGYFRVSPANGSTLSTEFNIYYGDLSSIEDLFQYEINVRDNNRVIFRTTSFWLSAKIFFVVPYHKGSRNLKVTLTMSNFVTKLERSFNISTVGDRSAADDFFKKSINDLKYKKDFSDYLNTLLNLNE